MKKQQIWVVLVVLLFSSSAVLAQQQWLHVKVLNARDTERVNINIPLQLVETVLPLLDDDEFRGGRIRIGGDDLKVAKMRRIWQELKSQGDFQMANIQSDDTEVNISLEGNFLIVKSTEGSEKEVNVQVSAEVVDALLSGSDDELNVLAAVEALKRSESKELIYVKDGDTTVNIWIDSQSRPE